MSDKRIAKKITARDVVFQLLEYQRLVSTIFATSKMNLREKNLEIKLAEGKLLVAM